MAAWPDIRAEIARLAANGTKAIFVDYLQLVRVPDGADKRRHEQLGEVTAGMKQIALAYGIPIVTGAQLNRASHRDGRPPTLTDLRESGSIEQDADAVLLLHSLEPGWDPEQDATVDGSTAHYQAYLAKNRSGHTGKRNLIFNRPLTSFRELENRPICDDDP